MMLRFFRLPLGLDFSQLMEPAVHCRLQLAAIGSHPMKVAQLVRCFQLVQPRRSGPKLTRLQIFVQQ